jgi:hypothetical protein
MLEEDVRLLHMVVVLLLSAVGGGGREDDGRRHFHLFKRYLSQDLESGTPHHIQWL